MRPPVLVLALILVLALPLAACAAQPLYAPAAGPDRPGYSEQRIEADRYRIVYRAGVGAAPQTLENFALRRAAEVTLENNADWFIVDHRRLDRAAPRTGSRATIGIGGGSFGRRSGMSVGAAIGLPLGQGGDASASAAVLDIRLGRGAKPDDPNAYDARETARALSAPPR